MQLIPLPYKLLFSVVLLALAFGAGVKHANKANQLALNAATQQKLEAEAKAALITTQTVEKVVYKDRIITIQGAKVTEYIDRNVTQIDATCTLSKEAVNALNDAAKEPT